MQEHYTISKMEISYFIAIKIIKSIRLLIT